MILGWLLGLLWLSLLWAWLGLHPGLHADALYLWDLLARLQAGGRLGTWDLPPAPSLWPDLGLLYAAAPFELVAAELPAPARHTGPEPHRAREQRAG